MNIEIFQHDHDKLFVLGNNYCENAVYYYIDGGNRVVEEGLLNNTKIIINNLHKPMNTNIDMTRSHIASCTSNINCLGKGLY